MIEFLVFYWAFAALFTLGWSEIAKGFDTPLTTNLLNNIVYGTEKEF